MKKYIIAIIISMLISVTVMAKVIIVYDPDTGTAKPIVVIGDD